VYPSEELTALAHRKSALRSRIAMNRLRCTALAAEVARPIAWIDRFLVQWRKISPFTKIAALPLGYLLRRKLLPRRKTNLIGQILRWAPVALRTARIFSGSTRSPS
jgi:hypothetical protein